MAQILLIEDDLEICEILQFYLLKQPSYGVTVAHSAKEALVLMPLRRYDLILLDIMLPDQDGVSLCQELRRITFCPIIFISCLSDDETVIRALNMGGDDYLIKPFQAPVLLARIEANLRRYALPRSGTVPSVFCAGALRLDTTLHTATKGGTPVLLSPTEYELLCYFMQHPGRFILGRSSMAMPQPSSAKAMFQCGPFSRRDISRRPPCSICSTALSVIF